MFNRLKPKSEFARNVLTLMTGTTIAQAIPIAISPILTRLYTPEDFGVFALYMSVASILSVVATGRYELAIMLPKKDEDAINIVALSLIISFLVSFMALLVIFFFNASITNLLGNPEISDWLYFIPLTVLLTGAYQSFNYWSNRKKEYKRLARSRIIKSGVSSSSNLGMGVMDMGVGGFILSGTFGQMVSTFFLGKGFLKKNLNKIERAKMMILSKKYIKFPKYDMLASLANISSQQLLAILFTNFFTSTIAGYFYLTQRILGFPITLLASSVTDVFRQSATKEYHEKGEASVIFQNTFKKLFFLSLLPTIFIYYFVVDIFKFVFGEEWGVSGEYAQILLPMFFLRFVVSPLTFMLYLAEKQKINLLGQIILISLIFFSFYLSSNEKETIGYISCSYSFIYLVYFFISLKISQGYFYVKSTN